MARNLDGTGDYIVYASDARWNPSDMSWFARVMLPTGHGNAQFDRILECGGFNQNAGWGLEIGAGGNTFHAATWNVGASTIIGSDYTPALDTWIDICVTMSTTGPSNKFYANAVQQGATSTAARATGAKTLTVGARNDDPTQNQVAIKIADFAIFNRVLTQAEIQQLSAASDRGGYSPLFFQGAGILSLLCPMNNGDSPEVDWASGMHGTVTGATTYPNPPVIWPNV